MSGAPLRVYPSPFYRTFRLALQVSMCPAREVTAPDDVSYDMGPAVMFTCTNHFSINHADPNGWTQVGCARSMRFGNGSLIVLKHDSFTLKTQLDGS